MIKEVENRHTYLRGGKGWTPYILFLGALLVYSIGLGSVHLFDWDEINFAESAREMLVSGNYLDVQVNFETFWEKPPLFIWMQVLLMKVFGVGEFGARFPNAVAGGATLVVLYLIGVRLKDQQFGLLWSLLYGVSFLPFFYFKSGIIDPWFNLFIFLGIYYLCSYTSPVGKASRSYLAILSAFFIGLATLTKGPVSLLIMGLIFLVMLALDKGKLAYFKWKDILYFALVYAVVGGLWFILQIANGHWSIIQDFIIYQIRLFETKDAGHGGFPLYHFVILFFGVFPASLLALPTMKKGVLRSESTKECAHFFRYMMVTLWVVLILFTVVRTKIVHYSSMCYFPITFLATYYLYEQLKGRQQLSKWLKYSIICIGALVSIALMVLPNIDLYVDRIIPLVDPFTAGNLSADGGWKGYEWLPGLILLATLIYFGRVVHRSLLRATRALLIGCGVTMFLGVLWVVPRVEVYSQKALVDFFEQKKEEDCYIFPLFKSYAHYFYSDRQPENNHADSSYLMRGEIDKPVYFAMRLNAGEEEAFIKECPEAIRLYDKNGFCFYVRYPKKINNE